MSLIDKRLLFVTGKGGVGKSTVAAALGVAASRRGKRTIICEVAQQDRIARVFQHKGVGYHETEIAPQLFAFSIDPQRALEEYLLLQIRIKPLYELLFRNRVFTYFAAATPGLRELVTIGKVWELAQLDRRVKRGSKYDLVIVDAPATGHSLGLLRTPKTFGQIARVGPIKRQADTIFGFVTDESLTGVCAVAWPEEMPVNETLDLQRNLKSDLGMTLDRIVMNGIYPDLFSDGEAEIVRTRYERELAADGRDGIEVVRRAALRAALSEYDRARSHREQLRRLEEGAKQDIAQLPFLFDPALDMTAVETLADSLEKTL
jgi:anion-transporting  ArsA/GET3 family ATPase